MNIKPIISVRQLKVFLGNRWVLNGIDLSVMQGEILSVVGGSGSGKSTLLRSILALQTFSSGSIKVFGCDFTRCSTREMDAIRPRWGVLFQQSALFSSLTVLENVAFPLQQYTALDPKMITEVAMLKIALAGLPVDAAVKYPSELSGGMKKRAALARAIAMDPELLFLDEPTAGLDPEGADAFDELVRNLQKLLKLTIVIVTHDLDTLWRVSDRVAFLGDGKVLGLGTPSELSKMSEPLIQAYFSGPRARAVAAMVEGAHGK